MPQVIFLACGLLPLLVVVEAEGRHWLRKPDTTSAIRARWGDVAYLVAGHRIQVTTAIVTMALLACGLWPSSASLGLPVRHVSICGWFTVVALACGARAAMNLFPPGPIPGDNLNLTTGAARALEAVLSCASSPVFEEVLFRGFLLGLLRAYLPDWAAVVASSFVFGFAHPTGTGHRAMASCLGAAFAVVTVATGSIWPAAYLHAAINLSNYLPWSER